MSDKTVKAIKASGKVAIVEVGEGPKYVAGPANTPEELADEVKSKFAYGSTEYDLCMQALLVKFDYKDGGE